MSNYQVNVAKSRLSVGFNKDTDLKLTQFWKKNKVFDLVNQSKQGKTFVLLDGPPYANGQAHLGHALNKVLKDLVNKTNWFLGNKVNYRPGWDCYGLPLELVVEKKHGKKDLNLFNQKCRDLALHSAAKQRKVFRSLGVLGSWEKPYFTLSQEFNLGAFKTLSNLVKKNLLTYEKLPVHYCPDCASSLAEAELETSPLPKHDLYFKVALHADLGLTKPLFALVWTTTPWTTPMNQGLAYRLDFNYELWESPEHFLVLQNSEKVTNYLKENNYSLVKTLLGKDLRLLNALQPYTQQKTGVYHADFVTDDATGFVHLAASHGPEDFELCQKHSVQDFTHLSKYGVFAFPETHHLFSQANNKKFYQANNLLVKELSNLGALVSHTQTTEEQNVCWRHKSPVYYNATHQVFLNLELESFHLKNKFLAALNQTVLSQKNKDNLMKMMLSRKKWCLSRQRYWGTPLNLLVDKKNNLLPQSSDYLDMLSKNNQKQATQLLTKLEATVVPGVLDVWFDSGNVANNYFNLSGTTPDLVLEGKDQFRGWFQSLFWLSLATRDSSPYKNLLSHGFVLDKNKEKFAKSKGNAPNLNDYLNKYGADTLRLWVAMQDYTRDAVFSDEKLNNAKVFYSRLRLTFRFLSSNLYDYDYHNHQKNLNLLNNLDSDLSTFALEKMQEFYQKNNSLLKEYNFSEYLNNLYEFAEKFLSNFYFDWAKNLLYLRPVHDKQRLALQVSMYELMLGLFDLVAPLCPYLAEEFYQDYFGNNKSVFLNNYFLNNHNNYKANFDWNEVWQLRKSTLGALEPLQKSGELKSRMEATVTVSLSLKEKDFLVRVSEFYRLEDLLSVSEVKLLSVNLPSENKSFAVKNLKDNNQYQKCPRCWAYKPLFTKEVCNDCSLLFN